MEAGSDHCWYRLNREVVELKSSQSEKPTTGMKGAEQRWMGMDARKSQRHFSRH